MPNLNFWGKLNTLKEGIKFDEDRKKKIRDYLIREINISESANSVDINKNKKTFWSGFIKSANYQFRTAPVFVGILLLLVFGGGVSFAANESLPGDLLYSIKVGVNEKVLGAVIFSEKAKIELEASLATRRLEEAEALTLSGKINEDLQVKIGNDFEKHSKKVSDGISRLESNTNSMDASDINSKFESSLQAHEQIIRKLGDNSSDEVQLRIRPVEAKVRERLKNTSSKRSELDLSIAKKESDNKKEEKIKSLALNKIKEAKEVVNSLQKFIEQRKNKISAEIASSSEAQIKEARSLIDQANSKIESSLFGESFSLAQKAIRIANKSRVINNASTELKLDGRLIDKLEEDIDKRNNDVDNKIKMIEVKINASTTNKTKPNPTPTIKPSPTSGTKPNPTPTIKPISSSTIKASTTTSVSSTLKNILNQGSNLL